MVGLRSVPMTAAAIPAAASCMPRRALSGFVRLRSPRMKRTDAVRYETGMKMSDTTTIPSVPSLAAGVLLEHPQHPIGDDEPADDVAGRADHGDEAEDGGDGIVVVAGPGGDDRSDERNAADRVGGGHEWRVQQRWHALDDHVADEAGEDEDVDVEKEHYFRIIFPRISSFTFSVNFPSFTCGLSSSKMFRPNIWLAL